MGWALGRVPRPARVLRIGIARARFAFVVLPARPRTPSLPLPSLPPPAPVSLILLLPVVELGRFVRCPFGDPA